MSIPVTIIADKAVRMMTSMVYLATRDSDCAGATSFDIAQFLGERAPLHANLYHEGMVERTLSELQREGAVSQAGARWYPVDRAGR